MPLLTKRIPVTIGAGASVSAAVLAGDGVVCAVIVPSGWTAAALSYLVSDDDGATYNSFFDDGNPATEISIAQATMVAAAARNPGRVALDPSLFAGVSLLQLRSGLSTAAINQVSAVTLYVVIRKFYAIR